jgi:hypothetical protein
VIIPLMEIEIGMAMEIIFRHKWKVRMGKKFAMELEIRMEKLSQEWNKNYK